MGAITPGPVNVLAIRHGAAAGRLTALAYVLGASLSYALVVWLMGQGGAWLLRGLGRAGRALAGRGLPAAPGLAGGQRAAHGAGRPGGAPRHAAWAAWPRCDGGLTQSLNPKAWLVALSGIGLFVLPQADAGGAGAVLRGVAAGLRPGRGLLGPGRPAAGAGPGPAGAPAWFNRAMGALLALSVASMLG
jgi:threonine/homoserine/homoserine lactone efflux protein